MRTMDAVGAAVVGILAGGMACGGGGSSSGPSGVDEVPARALPSQEAERVEQAQRIDAQLQALKRQPRPVLPGEEPPTPAPRADATRGVRGMLSRKGETISWTACGAEAPVTLSDPRSVTQGAVMTDGTPGYAELWIEGNPGSPSAVALLFADPSGETRGCAQAARTGWRAGGNEPFWSLTADPDGTVLSTPEWKVELGTVTRQETSLVAKAGDEALILDVEPVPCTDDMAGSRYGHTARVRWHDTTFTGCAAGPLDPTWTPKRSGPVEPGPVVP